ncbi:MAG: PepSY domain-containing protein [Spirosomataceae bacterium]
MGGRSFIGIFSNLGYNRITSGMEERNGFITSTQKGQTTNAAQWISLDSIRVIAKQYAQSQGESSEIDRIDVRPQKGVAKIVFVTHFTELQIDCTTGRIVSKSTRTSDIIEKIHDGSILDFWSKTDNDPIKLAYTSLLGIGLILLTISGFFLWYNPIKIRKAKSKL